VRQPAFEHVLAPPLDVVVVQRLGVERAETVPDTVCIDRQHGRDVGLGRGTYGDVAGTGDR
jgi:hypothetical protein